MPSLVSDTKGIGDKGTQVSSIFFGMKNFKTYEMCVNITALTNRGQSICNMQANDKAHWNDYEEKLEKI
jgi:hypothetical protein